MSARSQSIFLEGEIVEPTDVAKGRIRHVEREVIVSSDGRLDLVIRTDGPNPALLNYFFAEPVDSTPNPDPDPSPDPEPKPAPANDTYLLDFGTANSTLQNGMTRVTASDTLDADRAFGFIASESAQLGTISRQGYWGDHSRDFVQGTQIAFSLRMSPNQRYTVRYGYGDPISARAQSVSIEGEMVEQMSVAKGRFRVAERDVVASSDGLLEVVFRPLGPRPALINLLIVKPSADPAPTPTPDPTPDPRPSGIPQVAVAYLLDFGTAGSAIQPGMHRVTPVVEFTSARNIGFVFEQSIQLGARNRQGKWGNHSRDFVEGRQIAFSLRLVPNHRYTVRYGFGDPLTARSQTVSIDGRTVEQAYVAKGQLRTSQREVVTSSDGVLEIKLRARGTQPALINYLIVSPGSAAKCPGHDAQTAPAWVDVFPKSNAPQFEPDRYEITCSDQFATGTSWFGLDERQVFAQRFEVADPDQKPLYEYRLGKGSQLYSLRFRDRTGAWREAVATQRSAQVKAERVAEWVDEVIQTVLVDTTTNRPWDGIDATNNQIHQAGTYRNLPGVATFYSPVLAETWMPNDRAYASLVWPQQAHIPSNFKSHFLLFQQIRDLGSGVLEVTHAHHNYSTKAETVDFIASPWMPIRHSSLPVQHIGQGGKLVRAQRNWCATDTCPSTPIHNTDGYFMFSSGTHADDTAVAIVFGTDVNNEGQSAPSSFRWGTLNMAGRDMTASSLQKRVRINPGQIFYHRLYIVVNTRTNARDIALALQPYVDQGYLTPDPALGESVCLALQGNKVGRTSCNQDDVLLRASTTPRNDWVPLLVATKRSTGQQFVTNDPYLLARRPYLREYIHDDILGWISPEDAHELMSHPDPQVAQRFRFSV